MLWFSHLRRMLQRDRLEKDLDEELRLHLDMRAADNMTAGMTPEEAGRDARRRLENVTALKTGNMGTSRHFCGVAVWRGGLAGAYRLPTLSVPLHSPKNGAWRTRNRRRILGCEG